jgi:hypothetical protein
MWVVGWVDGLSVWVGCVGWGACGSAFVNTGNRVGC